MFVNGLRETPQCAGHKKTATTAPGDRRAGLRGTLCSLHEFGDARLKKTAGSKG